MDRFNNNVNFRKMKKVLIIGDSCEDVFIYGTCDRLSPEAPVPVFKPTTNKISGGMSMNVYENLKALGIEVDIITNKDLPRKYRFIDEVSNQMILRVDEDDDIKQITLKVFELIDFDKYDAVVVSDYNKGFLSEIDIDAITVNHPLVFMDTKKKISEWAQGIEFIKINEKEAQENSEWLTKDYEGELVVTLGKKGARHWFNPIEIQNEHPVRDLSGAGDTFLAALVADYIKNNDIRKAIEFANRCAAWVVTQKGVVAVDSEKI